MQNTFTNKLLALLLCCLLGSPQAWAQLNLNQALRSNGASATASSQEGTNYDPNNAIDGNFNTRWSSQFSDPQTLVIDLGAVQTVDRIRISWETAYASSFAIDLSMDGTTFTTIKSVTNNQPTLRNGNQYMNEYPNLNGGQGRYVRLRGLTRATNYGYSIYEFEVYSFSNTDANLAQGKTGDASNIQGSYFPANAFDGDDFSRWSTLNTSNQYVYVDLMGNATLSRVFLHWENAYGVDFQLQTSNDLTTWSTFATITGNAAYYNELSVYATGRYVRMLGVNAAANTGGGFSLWEFQMFGTITPLPVQLLSFAAQRQPAAVALGWGTASELNNRGFEVQRSANGTDFTTLAFVSGAGSSASAHHYQYADATAPAGLCYYRLRQVDQGGTSAYSPTVAVASSAAAPEALSLFPNPATTQATLSWQASATHTAHWVLRNVLGQAVQSGQLAGEAGPNALPLPLAGLTPGPYMLTLDVPGQAAQRTRLLVE